MNNKATKSLLDKILADAPNMTLAEIETVRNEMKYREVGTDYDHNHNPIPSFWAEINQGYIDDQSPGANIWAKFDTLDEEQYYMWYNFINRIKEIGDDVWRRAHAHKSR